MASKGLITKTYQDMTKKIKSNTPETPQQPLLAIHGVVGSAYINGVFVNKNGKQICEWCGSENITDPISDTCLNGICNDCGSHW